MADMMPRSLHRLARAAGHSLAALVLGLFAATAAPAEPLRILVVGDSLSAAYGIPLEASWVHLLETRLSERPGTHEVVNAAISGDTTRGGLARLPQLLERHDPDLVILELGGNDGLRGVPPEEIRGNLSRMVAMVQAHGARVLLVGIRIPPNYGPAYTSAFEAVFPAVAERHDVPLVPFLLEGVAGDPELMQADGIHPQAAAQPRILANVWPHLRPLLAAARDSSGEAQVAGTSRGEPAGAGP